MNKLSRRAEELLLEILSHRDVDGNCDSGYWEKRFEKLSDPDDAVIRSVFKELRENDMINVLWADNYPYIINVLAHGLDYFEECKREDKPTSTYTNNFYGDNAQVQIQQGCSNSSQVMNADQEIDLKGIIELINTVNKYDSALDQDYGKQAAELRELIKQLNALVNEDEKKTGKIKSVLNFIRDLTVNAGGGLIATAILTILQNMG